MAEPIITTSLIHMSQRAFKDFINKGSSSLISYISQIKGKNDIIMVKYIKEKKAVFYYNYIYYGIEYDYIDTLLSNIEELCSYKDRKDNDFAIISDFPFDCQNPIKIFSLQKNISEIKSKVEMKYLKEYENIVERYFLDALDTEINYWYESESFLDKEILKKLKGKKIEEKIKLEIETRKSKINKANKNKLYAYNVDKYITNKFVYYYTDGKKVYYNRELKLVKGADPYTFRLLEKNRYRIDYGIDKNQIYFFEKPIKGSDPNSFKIINCGIEGGYAKDKNHLYFCERKIENVTPKKIKCKMDFLITQDAVIFNGKKLDIDIDTYEILWFLIKDKNKIINSETDEVLDYLDKDTFKFLEQGYARDKNNIYYSSHYKLIPLENCDKKTFEVITTKIKGNFSLDKNQIFYNGISIGIGENLKKITFHRHFIIGKDIFYKRGQKLYKLQNLNPKETVLLGKGDSEEEFIRDKNTIYYQNQIMDNVDIDTFKLIDNSNVYFKDKKNIYFLNKRIEAADIKTFTLFCKGTYYAKDKKNIYFCDRIVTGADVNTFIVDRTNLGDAKDCNHTYWQGKKTATASVKLRT